MAQHTITNSCGHSKTYQLYGASKDRTRKIDWLKTVPCPTCKTEQSAKQNSTAFLAENEARIEFAAERLLKSLMAIPLDDRAQAIRQVEHQIAEGLGDEIRREAARRATDRYRATHEEI